MPAKDLSKLIEKLNHEKKNAIKNGIYPLIKNKFSYNANGKTKISSSLIFSFCDKSYKKI